MLRYFFEDTGNPEENAHNAALFQGLKIMEAGASYTEQMGKYPVINLTLKSAKQNTFESAYYKLKEEIGEEFKRHRYLLDSLSLIHIWEKRRCGNPGGIERFHRRNDCIRGIFPGTGRCGV